MVQALSTKMSCRFQVLQLATLREFISVGIFYPTSVKMCLSSNPYICYKESASCYCALWILSAIYNQRFTIPRSAKLQEKFLPWSDSSVISFNFQNENTSCLMSNTNFYQQSCFCNQTKHLLLVTSSVRTC